MRACCKQRIQQMTTQVKNSISSSGELLLYGDIGDYWDDMDALSVVQQLETINSNDITVRIHSGGGLITEGLAIYNRLKESKDEEKDFYLRKIKEIEHLM